MSFNQRASGEYVFPAKTFKQAKDRLLSCYQQLLDDRKHRAESLYRMFSDRKGEDLNEALSDLDAEDLICIRMNKDRTRLLKPRQSWFTMPKAKDGKVFLDMEEVDACFCINNRDRTVTVTVYEGNHAWDYARADRFFATMTKILRDNSLYRNESGKNIRGKGGFIEMVDEDGMSCIFNAAGDLGQEALSPQYLDFSPGF